MLSDILMSLYVVGAISFVAMGVRRYWLRGTQLGVVRSFAPLFQFYGFTAASIFIMLSLGGTISSYSIAAFAAAHVVGFFTGIMRAKNGWKGAARVILGLASFVLVFVVCFSTLIRSSFYYITHRDSTLVVRDRESCDSLARYGYLVTAADDGEGTCKLEHVTVWFGTQDDRMNAVTTADGRWVHMNKDVSVVK